MSLSTRAIGLSVRVWSARAICSHLDSLQVHSMTIFYMQNYDNWQAPPYFYFWKCLWHRSWYHWAIQWLDKVSHLTRCLVPTGIQNEKQSWFYQYLWLYSNLPKPDGRCVLRRKLTAIQLPNTRNFPTQLKSQIRRILLALNNWFIPWCGPILVIPSWHRIAREGHNIRMFCRVVCLFRRLNVLVASTSRTASVSSSLKIFLMACTAASLPDFWPAHNWCSCSF